MIKNFHLLGETRIDTKTQFSKDKWKFAMFCSSTKWASYQAAERPYLFWKQPLEMGNVQSTRKNEEVSNIWRNSEAKANQVFQWYREERLREKEKECCDLEILLKTFNLYKNGRSIGTIGVKKILKNVSPLKFTNKINPVMALMLSLVMTLSEKFSQSQLGCDSALRKLPKLVDKAVYNIRFGKDMCTILHKMLCQIKNQLASIGKSFEGKLLFLISIEH